MSISPIKATCYSQRMLNPFRGVVNVMEIAGADAVSRDGEQWILFVQGEREEQWVEGRIQEVETPDVKFGTWSPSGGLRRAPVRYVTAYDGACIATVGGQLLEAVQAHAEAVPFPLRDRFELWLLDRTGAPLVLLDSACTADGLAAPSALHWRPGELAKRAFTAPSRSRAESPHSELVARLVEAAAGATPGAQWFRRGDDGAGEGLLMYGDGPTPAARRLEPSAFPELLLRTDWPAADDARLVREFLNWQAPWLLQLQHLSGASRAALEQAARLQAQELAARRRLIPEVVDDQAITAALVEARLRNAQAEPEPEAEALSPLFPFLNE